MAHVLKMLEVPRDLEVERLRARTLGEPLRDRRGRRARCPRRYFADGLRETNDCVRLKLVGPPSEHVFWCYAYQLVAKALPVRQPRVAEGELRQRACRSIDAGDEHGHASSSPFFAVISPSVSVWIWRIRRGTSPFL